MDSNLPKRQSVLQIPNRLNLALLILAQILGMLCLYGASHVSHWFMVLIVAIAFSLIGNTLFSLLHEAVHGTFNTSATVNRWAGLLLAFWFPTSFLLQKSFHLTHHTNNRNINEQFDVLHDQDVTWLKYAQWYCIFTGVYWFITIFSLLLYLIVPNPLIRAVGKGIDARSQTQTGGKVYLEALLDAHPIYTRFEIASAIGFQMLICWLLAIHWQAWLICYAAFAFQWSSLQYTDHAFSPLDRQSGAWNLKVPKWFGIWFLNYHCHLAHHQNPQVSWLYLNQFVDKNTICPTFWSVWRQAWLGPRAADDFPRFD